jgi:ATP/ADP translocase
MASPMGRWNVDPREWPTVSLLTIYLFCLVSTLVLGRIARDALFLARHDRSDLPWMYLTTAVVVILPAVAVARLSTRMRRERLLQGALVITIIGNLIMRLLLAWDVPGVVLVLYNYVEVCGTFLMLLYWTFASDVFPSRDAKRLFPIIATGGIAAGIVCGVVVSACMRVLGTANLLLVQVGLLLVCIAIVRRLSAMERMRLQEAALGLRRPAAERGTAFSSTHMRVVGLVTLATFFVVPLIDYQYKVAVQQSFTIDGVIDIDGVSRFMGLFSAATGIAAGLLQLGLARPLLRDHGIVVALLLLPVTLLVGLLGGAAHVVGAFAAAVFTKGAESSLRYGLYDATMQIIYAPVPSMVQGQAKAYIDGVIKPLAAGLAGVLLLVAVRSLGWSTHHIAVVAMVFIAAWCVLIAVLQRAYIGELATSLRQRRFDWSSQQWSITDDTSMLVLQQRLAGNNDDTVRALELTSQIDFTTTTGQQLMPSVIAVLQRDDPWLRQRALQVLRRTPPTAATIEAVMAHVRDDHVDVRAAAMATLQAMSAANAPIRERLLDPQESIVVRAAAAAALVATDDDAAPQAVLLLQHCGGSEQVSDRLAVANAFANAPLPTLQLPMVETLLSTLIDDNDATVRTAALAAGETLGAIGDELLPVLWRRLGVADGQHAVLQALVAHGDAIVADAVAVVTTPTQSLVRQRGAVRLLERIGSRSAMQGLSTLLDVPEVTGDAARALSRLRQTWHDRFDDRVLVRPLQREATSLYRCLVRVADLHRHIPARDGVARLLHEALLRQAQLHLDHVFRLLAIIHPPRMIEVARTHLQLLPATHSARRQNQNALELIDNLCDPIHKRWLLPVLESLPDPDDAALERLAVIAAREFALARQPWSELAEQLLWSESSWWVMCTAHLVAARGEQALLQQRPVHPDAVVAAEIGWLIAPLHPARAGATGAP